MLFLQTHEKASELDTLIKDALQALPDSVLVNLYVAEVYEGRATISGGVASEGALDRAKEHFENLVTTLQTRVDELKPELDRVEAKALAEKEAAKAKAIKSAITGTAGAAAIAAAAEAAAENATDEEEEEEEDGAGVGAVDDDGNPSASTAAPASEHVSFQHEQLQAKYKSMVEQLNLVWIQYMKFARRAEVSARDRLHIRGRCVISFVSRLYAGYERSTNHLWPRAQVLRLLFSRVCGLWYGCAVLCAYIRNSLSLRPAPPVSANGVPLQQGQKCVSQDLRGRSPLLW